MLRSGPEKKECAEESRGVLVKLWREKAKPEKRGKAFRGIIDQQCMTGIPEFLQARCRGKKWCHLYVKCNHDGSCRDLSFLYVFVGEFDIDS